MKKLVTFLFSLQVIIVLALVSCSLPVKYQKAPVVVDANIPDDEISQTYFSKDLTKKFQKFLLNPEENVRKIRTLRSVNVTNASTITENKLFADIWESLSKEEKQMIRDNPDKLVAQYDSHLTVDKDSPVARTVRSKNDDLLGEMVDVYRFNAKLNDLFRDKTVPVSMLPEEFSEFGVKDVPAVPIFDKYIREENWAIVNSFLKYLDYPISLELLKTESKKLLASTDEKVISRAAGVIDYYTTPLKENLGGTLVDGAILLESSHKKAYYGFGTYSHGGIFSQALYLKWEDDANHCVYTAQPDDYDGFPENMMPDRPGYACLDTIFMYTKQRRYAVVVPKSYTSDSAKKAINTAKTKFYDPKPKYSLPKAEIFRIGNTSHDMTNKNTYCTKVVYTAWKSVGKDLDSNVFGGNIITPDDIYGSTTNRYSSFTLTIFWWSKTWTWQTYKATSDLVDGMER